MSIDVLNIGPDVEMQGDVSAPRKGALPSGLYPSIIQMAYLGESSGGALTLELVLKSADGKYNERRHTLYLTTSKAKGRKNQYIGRDGKPVLMSGMERGEELHRLLTGRKLANAKVEKKVIKLRNWETRQDEPTEVNALPELINQPILMGLECVVQNKRIEVSPGKWEDGPEEIRINEIIKFFDKDGFTYSERDDGLETPQYIEIFKRDYPETWERNKFKPVKSKAASNGAASTDDDDDDLPWPSTESSSDGETETVSLFKED